MRAALLERRLVSVPDVRDERRPAAREPLGHVRDPPGPRVDRRACSCSSTRSAATSPTATSSCSPASSSRPAWPSTTPAGSPGCAPSAPTRSAPASPATSTTASASRSPTSPSSSTASPRPTRTASRSPSRSSACATTCGGVIGEVRDTLYDLRTDVSETQRRHRHPRRLPRPGAGPQRARGRARDREHRPPAAPPGAGVLADRPGGGRQRRAPRRGARRVDVRWWCDGTSAVLQVIDDGRGLRRRASPAGSIPTGSWACGSGRPASAPPSTSTRSRARAPPCAACSWASPSHEGRPDRRVHGDRGPSTATCPSGGMSMTIRLVLADDHRMLREGLRRSMTDEGFDVVGEAADGEEAVRALRRAAARRGPDGRHHARRRRRRRPPPASARPTPTSGS